MQRNLYRLRAVATPRNPMTLDEIVAAFSNPTTKKKYGFTKEDPPSPFYHSTHKYEGANGFTVFVNDHIQRNLDCFTSRRFFADGTFRVVPSGCFKQLFIIHVEYQGHVNAITYTLFQFRDNFILFFRASLSCTPL